MLRKVHVKLWRSRVGPTRQGEARPNKGDKQTEQDQISDALAVSTE